MTTNPNKKQFHITVNAKRQAELQRGAIKFAAKTGEIVTWQEYARRLMFTNNQ